MITGLSRRILLRNLAVSMLAVCNTLYAQDKPADFGSDPSHVSVALRMRVAVSIKETVETYFAHWQGVPDLDFDQAFGDYLNEIANTDDRRSFDMATMALMAKLQNGHTKFDDEWFWAHSGGPTGLAVVYEDHQWVVLDSKRTGIPAGSVIVSIDGQPIEDFYKSRSIYINASNDRARRSHLFTKGPLFPPIFDVCLASGKIAKVTRADPVTPWDRPASPSRLPDGVVYHSIPSFGDSKFENAAIDFLKAHRHAKVIIFDVRGNGGGNSPDNLLQALITKPYRYWNQLSAMSIGLLKAYAGMADHIDAKADPQDRGFMDGMKAYFRRPMLYVPGELVEPSAAPIYTGKLIVLADQACASACEDFLMPLKVTGRAIIIGDVTFGSTGQPKLVSYGNGMSLEVSAKRVSFGDGAPFEGVGVKPDIELIPTLQQLTAHVDPVLAKALEVAQGE